MGACLASPARRHPHYDHRGRMEAWMSFASWRTRMLLSQERVAELSGLSLRTIQRLEAGHTVSYASLRALAAAVKADVHLLAREFQAAAPTDTGADVPVVIRSLRERFWFGGPRPG